MGKTSHQKWQEFKLKKIKTLGGEKQFKAYERERRKKNRKVQKELRGGDLERPGSYDMIDIKAPMVFKHPFSKLIAGPSGSGKTMYLLTLLYNLKKMVDVKFKKIIWHYGVKQSAHEEAKKILPKIQFIEGLPKDEDLAQNKEPMLLIIDDLMKETQGDIVGGLFTRRSHHNSISCMYFLQNLFPNQGKGKGEQRDISLNAKYMVLFKNPRDGMQPIILGSQMGKAKFISECFRKATERPHGYLMLDFTQQADDDLRVRTRIFPQDEKNIVFLPKRRAI
jgi:hypothetical protein